jgi:hypothetical protein
MVLSFLAGRGAAAAALGGAGIPHRTLLLAVGFGRCGTTHGGGGLVGSKPSRQVGGAGGFTFVCRHDVCLSDDRRASVASPLLLMC